MKNVLTGVLTALACFAAQAWGAEANELTASQSIRINAAPEAVWQVVGDYNGSPRWLPLVERSEIVFGKNNRVGAIRLITRRNGTKVTERLLEHDPQGMRMAYTYVDGAVMASDYFPVITVRDASDGTSVVAQTLVHVIELHLESALLTGPHLGQFECDGDPDLALVIALVLYVVTAADTLDIRFKTQEPGRTLRRLCHLNLLC